MDFYGITRGTIRGEALKKLAELTVEHVPSNLKEINTGIQKDDFAKLLTSTPRDLPLRKSIGSSINDQKMSNVAIAPKEYETLVALCDATDKPIKLTSQIKTLIDKFRVYLFELPDQQFAYSIVAKSVAVAPWTLLGEKLTIALINLAYQSNKQYFDEVVEVFHQFIDKFFDNVDLQLSNF